MQAPLESVKSDVPQFERALSSHYAIKGKKQVADIIHNPPKRYAEVTEHHHYYRIFN